MQENRTPHTESKPASHIILHFHHPRRCPGLYPTVNQPFPLPSWFLSLLSSFFLLSYLLPSTHTKSLLLYRPCCLLAHTPSLSSNYLSVLSLSPTLSHTHTHSLPLFRPTGLTDTRTKHHPQSHDDDDDKEDDVITKVGQVLCSVGQLTRVVAALYIQLILHVISPYSTDLLLNTPLPHILDSHILHSHKQVQGGVAEWEFEGDRDDERTALDDPPAQPFGVASKKNGRQVLTKVRNCAVQYCGAL
jgi:hypothetical protein